MKSTISLFSMLALFLMTSLSSEARFVGNNPTQNADYLGLREANSYEQALQELGQKAIPDLQKNWEKMSVQIYLDKLAKEIDKLAKDKTSDECKRLKVKIQLFVHKSSEYTKSDRLPAGKTRMDVMKENLPASFYIEEGKGIGSEPWYEGPGLGNKA